MLRAEQVLDNKPRLLSIVVIGVVGILAVPVIVPHIYHTFHIMHIMLHVGGISMAAFLTILGAMAYYRLRTKRMMLTFVGFTAFIVGEIATLIEAVWPLTYWFGAMSLLEVGHFMLLLALGLIAVGAFRDD